MAGAQSGVHVVQLKPIVVPPALQEGNKFVRWDDDSTVGTPVTLRVDKNGFFLYWTDQNNETEFLEISTIRDSRTGKYCKTPRDGKLKDSITMGAPDTPLEDKQVQIIFGPDMVNTTCVNFSCNCKEVAQLWTDNLLKMAYNLMANNAPATVFLEKAHTRVQLLTDKEGKIPVKNIQKMFAQHKDDKKRVEKALESCGLPFGKNDTIPSEKLTIDLFFNFYRNLLCRDEVDKIFERLCGGKKKGMTVDQLVEFLNKEQRDPRLNEILYPYANPARARDIIRQYEPNKSMAQKGLLSENGFLRYLMGEDNPIVSLEKLDINLNMEQPLSHYFINSSHNTYLSGHQLTGKSSVEMYRQTLLTGCRCVELDCWNGRNSDEEPIITHGYTVVSDILLKEVLEAIADCAFKTSDYPVILSFENHCSTKQQAKMAMYCRKIFGDMIITEPFGTHQLNPGQLLPSPTQLTRKIIIKNKKKHFPRAPDRASKGSTSRDDSSQPMTPERTKTSSVSSPLSGDENDPGGGADDKIDAVDESDTDLGSDEEEPEPLEDTEEAAKESEAGAEMSALVNYVQPVRFHSFEYAERRNRSYEVSSFVETHATNLLKEHPVEFVNYNKRQLSRIYPKGTRVDSSNYMPQVFWNAGCQMVALNYQTLDLGMQLNLGIFEYNGRCGYLLKPDFMRRADRKFDPFIESTVDGIIAGTVSVKIISGQFLSDKRVSSYVEVDMYGLPADTVRRKFRTKTIPNNGINPVYDEEPFVFTKVVLPDLACLRISVNDDNGRLLGHRVLPVVGLRPGYRHICLRNEVGQPLTLKTLFVHITVKDYVPDGLSEWADALANPIAFQSMVEKHAQQLMALTDDLEDEVGDDPDKGMETGVKKAAQPQKSIPKAKSEERTKPGSSIDEATVSSTAQRHATMNGTVPKQVSVGSTSPVPAKAQDSNRRLNQPNSGLTEEGQDKIQSLLESEEANISAESIDIIRQHKLVAKITLKLEKELQALKKKQEKVREREVEQLQAKEAKILRTPDNVNSRTHNRFVRKFYSPCWNPRRQPKRVGEVDSPIIPPEQRAKLEDVRKNFSQTMFALTKEHFHSEMEIYSKYQEPLYSAIDKAMQLSQTAQLDRLQSLHDREVSELMKRLDSQTKEELRKMVISKKYKDKNELSRIKRELHQKLIDTAVAERQRFSSLLEKKLAELSRQHSNVKNSFEDERSNAQTRLKAEYEEKCAKLAKEFEKNSNFFLTASDAVESTKL
ncbi:LOW QUALITY PROTEIN: 1-phosphatidylinositol 4,5-bisphosphate phosphodiesterase classes I and II-like [Uloborus diversus]|uniref:LOW QUALITY PROTEIN: 1-phosphatidylinositol 4,5-bisphosphate phosphodiesterase classes I and II-like n=1 Tax=Uloborus diversus TaxID=327109 RepID=UPI00240A98B7|nr:LOW QUALITY PROTEIN: 1-phosphatidylinositol 4,5-bisphosphate phosphodiesterase classes I and II-like [Uloborus diversus]